MEKTHCSDFDGNINVWVLEGSDLCAKNYGHSVVQAWREDSATAMQDWCLSQGMKYKNMRFSNKMIRCFFSYKAERFFRSFFLILKKKILKSNTTTLFLILAGSSLASVQFFVEMLLVSKWQEC